MAASMEVIKTEELDPQKKIGKISGGATVSSTMESTCPEKTGEISSDMTTPGFFQDNMDAGNVMECH